MYALNFWFGSHRLEEILQRYFEVKHRWREDLCTTIHRVECHRWKHDEENIHTDALDVEAAQAQPPKEQDPLFKGDGIIKEFNLDHIIADLDLCILL
jgi:hypothetical protein